MKHFINGQQAAEILGFTNGKAIAKMVKRGLLTDFAASTSPGDRHQFKLDPKQVHQYRRTGRYGIARRDGAPLSAPFIDRRSLSDEPKNGHAVLDAPVAAPLDRPATTLTLQLPATLPLSPTLEHALEDINTKLVVVGQQLGRLQLLESQLQQLAANVSKLVEAWK